MVEIQELRGLDNPELLSGWKRLEEEGACPGLFSSRLWVTTWARSFAKERKVVALKGVSSGKTVGVLPVFVSDNRAASTAVNFLSPRGEFVADSVHAREFATAVLRWLRDRQLEGSFRGLPADSDTLSLLRAARPDVGLRAHERPGRVSPYIEMDGTWDGYLRSRARKTTHEWERKMRRLDEAGDVRVLRSGDGTDPDALVDRFIAVEQRSWKEAEGTSISGRGVETFYHELAGEASRAGLLSSFWVELDGRVIAFLFGVVYDSVYYAMKTSYDEAYAQLSPSVRLFHEAVGHAFGAGIARFDFLGRRARWKDEWANGWREHTDVTLYRPGLRGAIEHVLDSRVKPLARRAMGSGG